VLVRPRKRRDLQRSPETGAIDGWCTSPFRGHPDVGQRPRPRRAWRLVHPVVPAGEAPGLLGSRAQMGTRTAGERAAWHDARRTAEARGEPVRSRDAPSRSVQALWRRPKSTRRRSRHQSVSPSRRPPVKAVPISEPARPGRRARVPRPHPRAQHPSRRMSTKESHLVRTQSGAAHRDDRSG
jgi:hypothetical protein